MYEVITHHRKSIANSKVLGKLNLVPHSFFLISAHREENIETKNFSLLVSVLNELAEKFNLPVVVSTHPRTRNKIEETGTNFNRLIKLLNPLGFHDYNKLQESAKVVLSDSGTINEESSILNFPALNIREAHERPEAMEEARVMMVGLNSDRIMQGIDILESQPRGKHSNLNPVMDYQVSNVSEKIVRILHSYTDYVNRVTWKKY